LEHLLKFHYTDIGLSILANLSKNSLPNSRLFTNTLASFSINYRLFPVIVAKQLAVMTTGLRLARAESSRNFETISST